MTMTQTIDLDRSTRQTTTLLRLESVSKVHGHGAIAVQALRGITLEVRAGELLAIMGPSGSGKSTLLQIAGALDRQTTGSVLLSGSALETLSAAALADLRCRNIGYVFQKLNLISTLTAAENVALPLELIGTRTKAARAQAEAALDEVGVRHVAARYPGELSGGEQQRVAIARALIGERRLILADEPTGALDSVTGDSVLRLLRSRVDAGAGGILVTHEARHAAWADRTIFLRDGLIIDEVGAGDDEIDLFGARL